MSEKSDTHLKNDMGKPAERQRRKAKGPSPNYSERQPVAKKRRMNGHTFQDWVRGFDRGESQETLLLAATERHFLFLNQKNLITQTSCVFGSVTSRCFVMMCVLEQRT